MALAATTITYITLDEFRENSPRREQADAQQYPEDTVKRAIVRAERIIDGYIGYVEPYDVNQSLKFPRLDEDGTSKIDDSIKIACIEIASAYLKNESPDALDKDVKRESVNASGHTVEYFSSTESSGVQLPDLAKQLLDKWRLNSVDLTY